MKLELLREASCMNEVGVVGKAKFPWDQEPNSHRLKLLREARCINGFITSINPSSESFELLENLGIGPSSIPKN